MATDAVRPAGGFTCVSVGALQTNCYLVDDGRGGVAVVDPGADAPRIAAALAGRPVSLVLVTHGHFDHVGAVDALAGMSAGGWCIGAVDARELDALVGSGRAFGLDTRVATSPSRLLEDGDVVGAGELELRVVACPGHTPGGVAYVDGAHGLVFTGDTLFAGSAGRCDLHGGDGRALAASLARLAALPPDYRVLPGHGPASTIGAERRANPHVRAALRGC